LQAGQAEAKAEMKEICRRPIQAEHPLDLSKLQEEADQLSKFAQTIPPDVADIGKGAS
jgi:hypothetical protein